MLNIPRFIDHNKAQHLCVEAQRYYENHKLTTQVLPASLTSIDEVMQLAGVHHITISPLLLAELSSTPASELKVPSLFDSAAADFNSLPLISFKENEANFRLAFNLRDDGEGARKLVQVSCSLPLISSKTLIEFRLSISFAICRSSSKL